MYMIACVVPTLNPLEIVMKTLFAVFAAALLVAWSAGVRAANEVTLLHARSIVSTYNGVSFQQPTFDVLVANLAYAKQVYIHLQTPEGTWVDAPLSYNRPASNGYEVWSGSYLDETAAGVATYKTWNLVFDVKYVVNGQTYWDNNGGANYLLAKDSGDYLVGVNVLNESYVPAIITPDSTISGVLTLNNLGYAKQVAVVYSIDGWVTKQTAWATYSPSFWSSYQSSAANPNAYGFEDWSYTLNIGENATQVQYAISYTVNGKTYWDNNFGKNYTTTIQYGR